MRLAALTGAAGCAIPPRCLQRLARQGAPAQADAAAVQRVRARLLRLIAAGMGNNSPPRR